MNLDYSIISLFKAHPLLELGGGGTWFQLCQRMCGSLSEGYGAYGLQGSEMIENISLKMGIKLAASLNMGENYCGVLYRITSGGSRNFQKGLRAILRFWAALRFFTLKKLKICSK